MKTDANKWSLFGRRFFSAFLFALAVLLLVPSCSLKRFFNTNFIASSQSSRQESPSGKTKKYKTTFCCSLKQKTILVKNALKKQNPPSSEISLASIQTGFDLNYFLSREESHYSGSAYTNSSLPLFLQHRRLLL